MPSCRPLALALLPTLAALLAPPAGAQEPGVYRVPREARPVLLELGADVRHGDPAEPYVALLTPAQAAELERCGFAPTLLFDSLAEEAAATGSAADGGWTSYETMRATFYAYAAANSSIAAVESFGLSVQGRELFGLRVSDNVQVEEDEPEVVFWGSIHGDEFGSAEVPYLWALRLVDGYGVDPTLTQFVDDNEIWIVPLVNPDGHENGTRTNANGVDLNRDLGFQWDGWGGSPAPHSQPETRAVRDFYIGGNVALSATMHCSGNVLFYQWGFSPTPTPDDSLIQAVGALYSGPAAYNLVNSWADYQTHGELLDEVYGARGALCYTVEMSNVLAQLPSTYERNEAGMDAFCAVAGDGLHGLVTDALSGEPLAAAAWLAGNPIPSYTDPELGDLWRMVQPGTYDVTVWASGYVPATVQNVVVPAGGTGSFQVALQPGGGDHAFAVTAVNQEDPNDAYQNATRPAAALGAPDGVACSLGALGFLVLDLGAGHDVVDGPGPDFTVTEAVLPGDALPESYRVFAGDAYVQDVLVGAGNGTTSFDLAASGVGSTRYLRIQDLGGSPPNGALAGVDVDAVTVLNGFGTLGLAVPVTALSLQAGGVQELALDAGPANAAALYFLLGTTAGTTPGQPLPPSALTLPLNFSGYFLFTALQPNAWIPGSLAFLDANGRAETALTLPPGLDPSLAGATLHHAYALLDATSFQATFASNAVPLALLP